MSCCLNNKSDDTILISIDKQKLKEGDIESVSLFAFASNPNVFEDRLEDLGMEFGHNPLKDIYFLSTLHKMGGDKNGTINDGDGNPIKFDFMEFVKRIPIDDSDDNPIRVEWV